MLFRTFVDMEPTRKRFVFVESKYSVFKNFIFLRFFCSFRFNRIAFSASLIYKRCTYNYPVFLVVSLPFLQLRIFCTVTRYINYCDALFVLFSVSVHNALYLNQRSSCQHILLQIWGYAFGDRLVPSGCQQKIHVHQKKEILLGYSFLRKKREYS